jgi:hypothetical protein
MASAQRAAGTGRANDRILRCRTVPTGQGGFPATALLQGRLLVNRNEFDIASVLTHARLSTRS